MGAEIGLDVRMWRAAMLQCKPRALAYVSLCSPLLLLVDLSPWVTHVNQLGKTS